MKLESKRIYIDYIPHTITQVDLEQKFSEYGNVSAVEVKQRKNVDSNLASQFAYVTLTISKNDLSNCFEEFANRKWKGHWVSLQEAKESFMDRLKRERAEQDGTNNVGDCTSSQLQLQPTVPYRNYNTTKSTKVYHSSSSDEDNTTKQDDVLNGDQKHKRKRKYSNLTYDNENSSFSNQIEVISKRLSTETEAPNEKSEQICEADQKRLQSMIRMRRNYQQQKQTLKTALSNIDSKPKNKITFEEDSEVEASQIKKNRKGAKILQVPVENRISLFEEEEEEAEHEAYNFQIKEQFEGKKGQKLMQLQSRFKNDKRFTMDERFLEDEENADLNKEESKPDNEITLDEEKQKEFEILEQVLGKKVKHKSSEKDGKHERQNLKMMLRFDPSQPNHSKFEIKEEKQKKRKNLQVKSNAKVVEEAPKPEVSKETFYKIAVNLKDALHEKEEFSLANLFNKTIETVENEKVDEILTTDKPKSFYQNEPNPFRYDSSADEDDAPIKPDEKRVDVPPVHHNKVGPAKLWTESFFFKHDDYRLQEGLDFIKRLEVDEQSDFPKLRRNLHEIVKAKVRNNQRKNRPFRKKLGGKKRLRVKRAMKR